MVMHNFHITAKPFETVFSLLARAHIQLGSLSPLTTLKDLTGHRGYKPLSSLPSSLNKIRETLQLGCSPEDLISRHTLFNLYKPFLPKKRQEYIIEGMLNSGAVKSRVGLLKSHCGAADQLAFCFECAKDDIINLGFAYWRREHMLVGVGCCHLHKVPLTKVSLLDEIYSTRNLILPNGAKSSVDWTALQFERLQYIAEQVALVTNASSEVYLDSKSYVPLLKTEGLTTKTGHIRMRDLQSRVERWLDPINQIAPYNELLAALNVERSWVANLVAGKEGMHHPIKHIALWGALQCDYPSLIAMQFTMEQLILPFSATPKIEITKEILLDAVSKCRTATASAKYLNCSVSTILVLMEKYCLKPKKKPKKLTDDMVEKVYELAADGHSTYKISMILSLSISTINRIKRMRSG